MQELKVEFEERLFDKEPLSEAELKQLIGTRPVEDFINPRSTPYKELGLAGRRISKSQFIRLVRKDPNLLKRPLVVRGTTYLFGLSPAEYEKL